MSFAPRPARETHVSENGDMERALIRTVGHSTRAVDTLIEMLKAHGVKRLIDVRTIPKSRYNPQYNREALEQSLRDAGIGYELMKGLGGLRHSRKDSSNMGWRNESFRGYADYMQTPEFESALNTLIEAAAREAVVIMCAEAVPWRCHRSLISDALTARGYPVRHIMSATQSDPHTMTSFARVEGTSVTYPATAQEELPLESG
jgi:uncharacterized protein (DUF488 family)